MKKAIILLLAILVVGLACVLPQYVETERESTSTPYETCIPVTADKIDLAKYHVDIDYGMLSADQINVMDSILLCGISDDTAIKQNLSFAEFEEVIDYIGLYFGANLEHQNVALWRYGYAEVKPERIIALEQKKAVLDAEIDSIMSNIDEGTDEEKLLQVSRYLAKTIRYSHSLDDIEPFSGLSGKGSCMTYSMLFYKMAMRIGIQAYICYGKANNGKTVGLHAWNMVKLDGEQYFYDVTWYDSTKDSRYIHSDTPWDRCFDFSWRYSQN